MLFSVLFGTVPADGSSAYFTKEVISSLAKPPLKYSGDFAKLGLTSLVK